MGSEGRGEQILKTDQDNALLLRERLRAARPRRDRRALQRALADLGYPQCPGDIMLTNPLWRQPLAAFRETIQRWCYGPDPQGVMHLAIFLDASPWPATRAAARRARPPRSNARGTTCSSPASPPRSGSSARTGPGGPGSGSGATSTPLDLKKSGTFPIVHGMRALALRHRCAR
jgi:CBS domain-containing protein